jgi:hypothetical protein
MVQTLQPAALAIIVLFPALSFIAVVLRIYSRVLSRQFHLGMWHDDELYISADTRADDALILLAMSLAIGESCMLWLFIKQSWQGYHYYDIPTLSTAQLVQASKYDISNQLLYNPILALVKASVIIFLWRLEDRRKVIQWSLKILFVSDIKRQIARPWNANASAGRQSLLVGLPVLRCNVSMPTNALLLGQVVDGYV